jgi:hypothetical protein
MASFTPLLRSFAVCAAALVLSAPGVAQAQTVPSDMLGTFNAPAGGTLKSVTIASSGGGYTINVKATCSPTPCNWGTQPLVVYAPSAGTSLAKVGSAVFNQGFVRRTVIVTLQDATVPTLQVQLLSQFTPPGGRSNYTVFQTLQ